MLEFFSSSSWCLCVRHLRYQIVDHNNDLAKCDFIQNLPWIINMAELSRFVDVPSSRFLWKINKANKMLQLILISHNLYTDSHFTFHLVHGWLCAHCAKHFHFESTSPSARSRQVDCKFIERKSVFAFSYCGVFALSMGWVSVKYIFFSFNGTQQGNWMSP